MIDHLFEHPIGDFLLQEKIGEGTFSVVYSGLHQATLETRAFKIARPAPQSSGGIAPTRALVESAEGIVDADVDPVSILARQFEFLERMNGMSLFPAVDGLVQFDGGAALQMQFVPWRTLRERMTQGKVADADLVALATHLAELEKARETHGDLKPENILISREAVRLIDPGYFGHMALRDGTGIVAMVTTPEYYPLLRPDDMAAFGYILVELITGTNILARDGGVKVALPGPGLTRRFDILEMRKNRFLVPIGRLNRAGEIGEKLAASPLTAIALKALGMQWNDNGEIDLGPKYANFGELKAELATLFEEHPVFTPPPEEDEEPRRISCFHCNKPIAGDADTCPNCGAYLAAPACPRCRNPVSHDKDRRAFYKYENGRYAWNYRWDGRCVECGFDFTAELRVAAGHRSHEIEAQSTLHIRGDESSHMVCDDWDMQPTIEVEVRRAVAGSNLPEHSTVTLTPEEWHIVLEQLNGPLRVLMERRKWSRDTT